MFAPATSGTFTVTGTGELKLVPVNGISIPAPPLTLRNSDRVPDTAAHTVTAWVPADGAHGRDFGAHGQFDDRAHDRGFIG